MFAVIVWLLSSSFNAYGQQPALLRYRLSVAERKWALELEIPTVTMPTAKRTRTTEFAFIDPTESFTKDGNAAVLSAIQPDKNGNELQHLRIIVEPASQSLAPEDFRAFALKKLEKDVRSIKYWDRNHIPMARYTTDSEVDRLYAESGVSMPEIRLTSRNLEAYLVQNDVWARIRFTANSISEEQERLFYLLIDSARFVDVSNPSTSFDYYSIGRTFSAKKDYRRAAENFISAVKLEKIKQQLGTLHWRDLIMESAEAHVALSDLSAAAEVLEYGVTREPTNTTFLMQLARTYAALRDTQKTLATLKSAFFYMKQEKEIFEKTDLPGVMHSMSLPDLTKDPAFKEMMKDKAFRDAVKAMTK